MRRSWPQRIADNIAPRMGAELGSATHQELEYGANILFLNIPKFVILFVLALTLGLLNYVLWFMLIYAALRVFSFGVHFESTVLCTMLGLTYYLGSAYLATRLSMRLQLKAAIFAICILLFALLSPAETINRPITKRQRPRFKTQSLIILTITAIFALKVHDSHSIISNVCCWASVCQTINILPVTFRIVGRIEIVFHSVYLDNPK